MKLPIRILLIDSRVQDRRLARRVLRGDVPRVAIDEVADARALVEALAGEAPLMVIADADLGWADGVALLRQVKHRWPDCFTVLFSSASLDLTVSERGPIRCNAVLRKDTAGFNELAPLVLGLVAESREAVLAARGTMPRAAAAESAATSPEAAAVEAGPAVGARAHPADEDVGASTLDWFPEMEESEADEALRNAARQADQGPVHQLLPAVNLESVILTAMSQLKSLIRSTRARVRAGALPTLRLDRTDGLALFRNLIANAIEHAGGKPPVVTIHAERRDSYWLLAVHDNGVGIAGKDVGEALHLIHPPGRVDEEGDDGGLATCGQVARRYGGSLWVQPRQGGGTSVFVALCTAEAEAGAGADLTVSVQYRGDDMGRISVSSLSNKQQIAGRALELPRLRSALNERGIKDVVFIDADVVNVVA